MSETIDEIERKTIDEIERETITAIQTVQREYQLIIAPLMKRLADIQSLKPPPPLIVDKSDVRLLALVEPDSLGG